MQRKSLRLFSLFLAMVMGATAIATPASAAAQLSPEPQTLSDPIPAELDLDSTINNQAFMTDALTAMQKKVESSREVTRQLRAGEDKRDKQEKTKLRQLRDDHRTLEDSTTGVELEAGVTYYVDHDVTITNDPGKSAILLPQEGAVFIEVDKGCTLTATGGNATDVAGGGAGIQVPRNATLVLQGEGKVVATGGAATNGANGGDGEMPALEDRDEQSADFVYYAKYYGGNGGAGGKGGNGAGAGIGGVGGIGGNGGDAGLFPTKQEKHKIDDHPCALLIKSKSLDDLANYSNLNGAPGGDGTKGGFAPDDSSACGAIYVLGSVHVTAQGGAGAGNGADGTIPSFPYPQWSGPVLLSWEGDHGYNDWLLGCAGYGGAGAGGQGGLSGKAMGGGAAGGSGGGGGGSGATRQYFNVDVETWFNLQDNWDTGMGGFGKLGQSGEAGKPTQKNENAEEPYNYDIVGGTSGGSTLTTNVFGDCAGIYRDFGAKIDGVDAEDVTLGLFNVSTDGKVAPKIVSYIPSEKIPTLDGFVPENGGHYYIVDDITVNAAEGKSAFALPENIFCTLDVCDGVTVNLRGGDATDSVGAGAGIEVPETSSLIITGYGTLNATGGNGSKNGGAAAGIGGKGGNRKEDGQSCGTIYFPGHTSVAAACGAASEAGGCDHGIGGGAPGGDVGYVVDYRNGKNGEVYYDHDCGFKDGKISGRSRFYHDVRLALIDSSIHVQGYADLVLGDEYYGDKITLENLHNALLEANNRGALKEDPDTGYQIVDYGDIQDQNNNCHGSYRDSGNQWNKHFVDYSGGYLYLLSVVYGKFIQQNMGSESTPFDFNNWVLKQFSDNAMWMNDDMTNILKTLFFYEHYCEAMKDYRADDPYRKDHPTVGTYIYKDSALQCIQYTYVTVLDATSARYCTWMYDTERDHGGWDLSGYHYYYQLLNGTFSVVDGYKGVNSSNWMNFLPDDAPLAQINLPGSHDAGTFNTHIGDELFEEVLFEKWIDLFHMAANETHIPEFVWHFAVVAALLDVPTLIPLVVVADGIIDIIVLSLAHAFIEQMSTCQDLTIKGQLEAGVRHLDMRYAYDRASGEDKDPLKNLKVIHGTVASDLSFLVSAVGDDHDIPLAECETPDGELLRLRNVFDDVQAFLNEDASKNECVIITLQVEGGIDEKDPDSGLSTNKKAMLDFFDQEGDNIIRYKEGDVLPDMKDAHGKIIVILSDDLKTYDKHDAGKWDNPYADKEKALGLCFQEALNEYQDYSKKEPINKENYNPKCLMASCYDSSEGYAQMFLELGWGINGSPRKMADEINRWFNNQTLSRGQRYGWLLFNFPTDTICANWYYTNVFDIDKLIHTSNDSEESVVVPVGNGFASVKTDVSHHVPTTKIAPHTAKTLICKELDKLSNKERDAVEAGGCLDIVLTVSPVDEGTAEAVAIENAAKADGIRFLDLKLTKIVTDQNGDVITSVNLSEPAAPIQFTVTIPADIVAAPPGHARSFKILRNHNGVVEVLPSRKVNNTLVFDGDKFSIYAIAYTDSKDSEPVPSGDAHYIVCEACGHHNWTPYLEGYQCDNCGHLRGTTGVPIATAAVTKRSPKTKDDSNMVLYVSILLISAAGLVSFAAYSKRKHRK